MINSYCRICVYHAQHRTAAPSSALSSTDAIESRRRPPQLARPQRILQRNPIARRELPTARSRQIVARDSPQRPATSFTRSSLGLLAAAGGKAGEGGCTAGRGAASSQHALLNGLFGLPNSSSKSLQPRRPRRWQPAQQLVESAVRSLATVVCCAISGSLIRDSDSMTFVSDGPNQYSAARRRRGVILRSSLLNWRHSSRLPTEIRGLSRSESP